VYLVSCSWDIVRNKKVSFFFSIFRSCDLDLCPTNLNINRLPPHKKLSTHMPHAERNKSHELEVCGSKVKITISKNRTNLMLFNQNIVWWFLTKFGTQIDSCKMDVYGTPGISNLAMIFKMATKMPKNWPKYWMWCHCLNRWYIKGTSKVLVPFPVVHQMLRWLY
jgi:hypothetical protein